jgi:hypothetical protein
VTTTVKCGARNGRGGGFSAKREKSHHPLFCAFCVILRPVGRIFFRGHRPAKHDLTKKGIRDVKIPGKTKFVSCGQCGGMANITDYFLDFYRREFLRWVLTKQGR